MAQYVAQRARHQEIFLVQPQLFAGKHGIGRIKDAGNIFRGNLLLNRANVVAAIEISMSKSSDARAVKQTQEIYCLATVAGHRHIIGYADNDSCCPPSSAAGLP